MISFLNIFQQVNKIHYFIEFIFISIIDSTKCKMNKCKN